MQIETLPKVAKRVPIMRNPYQASPEYRQHEAPPPAAIPPPLTPYPQQAAVLQPQQPTSYPPPERALPPKLLEFPPHGHQTMSGRPVQFPSSSPHNCPMNSNEPNQPTGFVTQNAQEVNYAQPRVQYQQPDVRIATATGPSPAHGIPVVTGPGPHPRPSPVPSPSQSPQLIERNGWNSKLFDCMNDPMNALTTVLFPCVTFGQIAEIMDDGHTSCATSGMLYGGVSMCIGLPWIVSCTYRTKLRKKFGLPEDPAPDWITHFLCERCAICQAYRELQARGWDPSLGYQGNMARNQKMQANATMMAPMNQRMMG